MKAPSATIRACGAVKIFKKKMSSSFLDKVVKLIGRVCYQRGLPRLVSQTITELINESMNQSVTGLCRAAPGFARHDKTRMNFIWFGQDKIIEMDLQTSQELRKAALRVGQLSMC